MHLRGERIPAGGTTRSPSARRPARAPLTTVRTIVSSVVWLIVSGPPRCADVPQCRTARLYICMTITPTVPISPPDQPTTEALLVSIRQAADMLAISRSSIYNLIDADQLKPIRIGRSVRFPVEQLERFVAARIAREASATGVASR